MADEPIEGCKHHWLLATRVDALTSGICTRCGEARVFNDQPRKAWGNRNAQSDPGNASSHTGSS